MFKMIAYNFVAWFTYLIWLAPLAVYAHGAENHSATDTGSTGSLNSNTAQTTGGGHSGMTPFFHFHSGDFLYFEGWQLKNAGIIVAACAAVFVIAVFERLAMAGRAVIERRLHSKLEPSRLILSSTSSKEVMVHRGNGVVPPFMIMHELTRGGFYILQAALMYLLMLAVMTFHVGIILAVLLGAGVGEMLFGRYALNTAPH